MKVRASLPPVVFGDALCYPPSDFTRVWMLLDWSLPVRVGSVIQRRKRPLQRGEFCDDVGQIEEVLDSRLAPFR